MISVYFVTTTVLMVKCGSDVQCVGDGLTLNAVDGTSQMAINAIFV